MNRFTLSFLASSISSVTAIAGCGKVTEPPPPDGPIAPVRILALSLDGDGQPDTATIAIFVAPDGTVLQEGLVDATGRAEVIMPDGGEIHAIRTRVEPTSRQIQIQTIRGVKSGDDLVLGIARYANARGASSSMQATFPVYNEAYTHQFWSDCGNDVGTVTPGMPNGTVTLGLDEGCRGDMIDVLGVARDASPPTMTQQFLRHRFAYASGGMVTLPAAWQAFGTFNVTLTNVPDEINAMTVARSTALGAKPRYVASQSTTVGDPPAGTVNATVPYPAGIGSRAYIQAQVRRADAVAAQLYQVRATTIATSTGIDLATLQLPWLTVNPMPTADGVTWSELREGTPDVRVIAWQGRWMAPTTTTLTWYMIEDGAADSTVVTLPQLPPGYADIDPRQPGVTPAAGVVIYADRSDVEGYDQTRSHALENVLGLQQSGLDLDKAFQARLTQASGTSDPGVAHVSGEVGIALLGRGLGGGQ